MTNVKQPAIRTTSFHSPFGAAAVAFARLFWAVCLVEGLSLLFMSSLHVGARVPLGFTIVTDVRIVQATVAEAICGALLLVAVGALLARRSWAWVFAAISQALSAAAVLNGMGRVAAGAGPDSQLNDTYHLVIDTLLALGFVVLILPRVPRIPRTGLLLIKPSERHLRQLPRRQLAPGSPRHRRPTSYRHRGHTCHLTWFVRAGVGRLARALGSRWPGIRWPRRR